MSEDAVLKKVYDLLSENSKSELALKLLRDEGYSKIKSMLVLVKSGGESLSEAKIIVHESEAWSDALEKDEQLHDKLEEYSNSEREKQLLNRHAGTGQRVSGTRGQAGYRERVDFGETIGEYVDSVTGARTPTTNGIIHYSKNGAHIVPARPSSSVILR